MGAAEKKAKKILWTCGSFAQGYLTVRTSGRSTLDSEKSMCGEKQCWWTLIYCVHLNVANVDNHFMILLCHNTHNNYFNLHTLSFFYFFYVLNIWKSCLIPHDHIKYKNIKNNFGPSCPNTHFILIPSVNPTRFWVYFIVRSLSCVLRSLKVSQVLFLPTMLMTAWDVLNLSFKVGIFKLTGNIVL